MVCLLSMFHYRNNLSFAQRNMMLDWENSVLAWYRIIEKGVACSTGLSDYIYIYIYIYISVPFVCVCLLRYSNTIKPPLIVTHIHVHLRYMQLVMCFNNGAVMSFIPPTCVCCYTYIYTTKTNTPHTAAVQVGTSRPLYYTSVIAGSRPQQMNSRDRWNYKWVLFMVVLYWLDRFCI